MQVTNQRLDGTGTFQVKKRALEIEFKVFDPNSKAARFVVLF